jgi:putative addiction module killer protein
MTTIKLKPLPEFTDWLVDLKDPIAKAAIVERMRRAERGNLGHVETVGDGISE